MYFVSDKEEIIVDIVGVEISGVEFEISITKTFFAYEEELYAKKHNHAHFEVFLNKDCSGRMLVENTNQEFGADSMMIIAPKVYHSYRPDNESRKYAHKYNFKFKPDESYCLSGLFKDFKYIYIEDAVKIISIVEDIHNVYGSEEFASKQEIRSLFTLLMINILRHMVIEKPGEDKEAAAPEFDSKANEIEAFFERHYDSFPAPSELAIQLCVSTRQLDRILKQLFSMSFSSKLAQTKTELAKDLLETTGLSAAKISDKLGYNSPASFSAAFKKQTGLSPGTYRKNNEGAEK